MQCCRCFFNMIPRSVRRWKITLPPPIFLYFWPPPPRSQFTGAAAAADFYLGSEGQKHTKKKKIAPFLTFSSFFFLLKSSGTSPLETGISKFTGIIGRTEKKQCTPWTPIQLGGAPLTPPPPKDFGNPPPPLNLPQPHL